MNIKIQKYSILFSLFILNTILSTTFIYYKNRWYVYLVLLASSTLLYSIYSLLIIYNKTCSNNNNYNNNNNNYDIIREQKGLNYVYLVPCYNEGYYELINTFISILYQRKSPKDNRTLIVVCDGIVTGKGNDKATNNILLEIFNNKQTPILYDYRTKEGISNTCYIFNGLFFDLNYILIIKKTNSGKRDSLVLVRQMLYNYNKLIIDPLTHILLKTYEKIDYIIGVDADTVLDYNCSYELLKTIESDKSIHGCVGYVDINYNKNKTSLFKLYQYAEYMFAQCLKRQAQSHITHKVNCLSGCNQILRISEETCGSEIMEKFNYCPTYKDNIFTHIRSIASEDRNHVTLLLSMYPYVKTVQNLNAIAYTNVPTTLKVFLSQRRRWSLGANTNDLLLITLPNIKILEKISSFINVTIFTCTPFILIATAFFIKALIIGPSMLMLYLSIIMIIPFSYGLLIPLFIKQMNFRNTIYFYLSYIFFLTSGSIVNLIIYFYSLLGMDTIKWGKTREIIEIEYTYDIEPQEYLFDEIYLDNTNTRETFV
jgi:chitin synthase